MKPTIGRIVHYKPESPGHDRCLAAIVTDELEGQHVHLTVFPPGQLPEAQSFVGEGLYPGSWHWPEMVK